MIYMGDKVFIVKEKDIVDIKICLAKLLYKKRYSQKKISNILNITQPMVSNYLASNKKISKKIMNLSEDIINIFKLNNKIIFKSCITFNDSIGEFVLAKKEDLISDEKQQLINNLLEAINLLKEIDMKDLIPKVKVNIAMCSSNAQSPKDVASVEGGLIFVNNRLSYYGSVGFGKSNHLAKLLLKIKEKSDKINSIMNIRNLKLEKNIKIRMLDKDFSVNQNLNDVDVLMHKGGFGIEPCAYIIGKNAMEVVNKLKKIRRLG